MLCGWTSSSAGIPFQADSMKESYYFSQILSHFYLSTKILQAELYWLFCNILNIRSNSKTHSELFSVSMYLKVWKKNPHEEFMIFLNAAAERVVKGRATVRHSLVGAHLEHPWPSLVGLHMLRDSVQYAGSAYAIIILLFGIKRIDLNASVPYKYS